VLLCTRAKEEIEFGVVVCGRTEAASFLIDELGAASFWTDGDDVEKGVDAIVVCVGVVLSRERGSIVD